MSGTVKGRLQIYSTTGDMDTASSEVFVSIYKALKLLEIAGYVTEIANNYGDDGAAGTSLDYGGPKDNAFYVFQVPPYGARTTSWYLLIQWTPSNNFGNSPGDPARIRASGGNTGANVGIQMAAAVTSAGADDDPWANAGGGTGKAGADAKGDPVWDDDGTGTLYVFPRSNNPGGSHDTSKENCVALFLESTSVVTMRVNLIMDRDNMVFTLDQNDGNIPYIVCLGQYDPVSGLSPDAPFFMYAQEMASTSNGPNWDQALGDTSGVSPNNGGLAAPADEAVLSYRCFYREDADGNEIYQPNQQFAAGDRYMEFRIPFYVDEGLPNPGIVGFADSFFRSVSGKAAVMSTFNSLDRFVIGGNNVGYTNFDFPWDGATSTVDMASDREGTDF